MTGGPRDRRRAKPAEGATRATRRAAARIAQPTDTGAPTSPATRRVADDGGSDGTSAEASRGTRGDSADSGSEFSAMLARARVGDVAARTELYRRYAADVAARVRVRAPQVLRRRYDADDVAQSVFVEVLRDLEAFEDRGEAAFRAWLRTKVEGKLRGKLGRVLRPGGGRREVTAPSEVLVSPADRGPGPATALGLRDDAARLRALLDSLPADQRAIVVLRTEERLEFAEIAARLGLPTADTARMRFARALGRLRAAWDRT